MQILTSFTATARTRKSSLGTRLHVKDYAHALDSGVEFKFEIKDILVAKMATARSSCEASRTSTYSQDLRWRIVWQRKALNLSVREVAGNLCVDPSTVSRITTLFRTTGDVAKKPYPSERASRKLTEPAQFFVIYLMLERPRIYLREVQLELQTQLGLRVHFVNFCVRLDLQNRDGLHMHFREMSVYDPNLLLMFPFIVLKC